MFQKITRNEYQFIIYLLFSIPLASLWFLLRVAFCFQNSTGSYLSTGSAEHNVSGMSYHCLMQYGYKCPKLILAQAELQACQTYLELQTHWTRTNTHCVPQPQTRPHVSWHSTPPLDTTHLTCTFRLTSTFSPKRTQMPQAEVRTPWVVLLAAEIAVPGIGNLVHKVLSSRPVVCKAVSSRHYNIIWHITKYLSTLQICCFADSHCQPAAGFIAGFDKTSGQNFVKDEVHLRCVRAWCMAGGM